MSSSKKVLSRIFPWLLLLVGLFSLNLFKGVPGGVLLILGVTILVDRIMPAKKSSKEQIDY